ncbi:MAG: hypothetical protein JJE51_08625 [Thermoanaerobaculia bacterium]|nr:hypothetical protein [Thermoanaerobaculia bacterium]
MSWKRTLARILIYAFLQIGALAGIPMTPEQIEKLMNVMTRTKVEHTIRAETEE